MEIKVARLNEIKEEELNPLLFRKMITGEKIMFVQFILKKGLHVPSHKHESEQISYVIKGKLKFSINGKEYIIKDNELIVIPSNVPHEVWAEEDTIDIDLFAPPREDWLRGNDSYLRIQK
ncbi:MAG: cupin domain-containing protein [Thermoprotei archaeon]